MISAALVASLVGYGSTIALVLAAARAVTATEAQTASWVLAISLAKGLGSAGLSFFARVPVVLAWSTPGAALFAATVGRNMQQAVGAFVVAGLLTALTGAVTPLDKAVALIPDGIAAGMLAGVLVPFCLAGAGAAQGLGWLALPMLLVFAVVRLRNSALAVLAALATAVGSADGFAGALGPDLAFALPTLSYIAPECQLDVVVGLARPLSLVTMASQNFPGFATMRAAGYTPPVRPARVTTGLISSLTAFFGAHSLSMAAITAAICRGDDVQPDRAARWQVGLVYGGIWVALGLLSPLILPLLQSLPLDVIALIVALALLGPLLGALTAACAKPDTRFAATLTLTVTASGVAAFGVGAAFWGLLAGLGLCVLENVARHW